MSGLLVIGRAEFAFSLLRFKSFSLSFRTCSWHLPTSALFLERTLQVPGCSAEPIRAQTWSSKIVDFGAFFSNFYGSIFPRSILRKILLLLTRFLGLIINWPILVKRDDKICGFLPKEPIKIDQKSRLSKSLSNQPSKVMLKVCGQMSKVMLEIFTQLLLAFRSGSPPPQ